MKKFIFNFRTILKNITILNIILFTIIIIVLLKSILFPLIQESITYHLPVGKNSVKSEGEKLSSFNIPSPADYAIIAEENLFHPERKIPPEKKVEEKPLPKPDFILYGTVLMDNGSTAYLEDLKEQRSSPGRGRRQIALKKGSILSGFTLKEIYSDKIVMVRGEESIKISIYDSHSRNKKKGVISQEPATRSREDQPASTQQTTMTPQQTIPAQQTQEQKRVTKSRNLMDQGAFEFFEKRRSK